METLAKSVVKLFGIGFLVLVLAFTGFQTYSLIYAVTKDPVMALIGLILFEGGMMYWWLEFKNDAEGIGQMTVSLLLAVFGLALVAGSTALHLGAAGAEILGPNTPARLITAAAVINLIGKFTFPLLDPNTFKNIWERALEGMVTAKAYVNAQGMTNAMAADVGKVIAAEITDRAKARVLRSFNMPANEPTSYKAPELPDYHSNGHHVNEKPTVVEANGRSYDAPITENGDRLPPMRSPAPPIYAAREGVNDANFTERP